MPTLSQIWIHPVKSLAGYRVACAQVRERGLASDRAWVLFGPDGQALTQRTCPAMALVATSVIDGELYLEAPDGSALRVATASSKRCRPVIWGDEVDAADCGDAAATWLSSVLRTECRLAFMDAEAERTRHPDGGAGQSVRFADELPLMLLSEASLDDLDRRVPGLAEVRRFRPNLVVAGCEPYAEDRWKRVRIGPAEFEVLQPASRCALVNVDPAHGIPNPNGEPLRTLAGYRTTTRADYEHKPQRVYLGIRAAVTQVGRLETGMDVEVLE